MKLVIVESPSKSQTIEKYLGAGYRVLASYGHVRDLPKSKLGVDLEHQYRPDYLVPTKAKKVLNQLIKEAKSAEIVLLATDPDREGEAIAWHISEAIKDKAAATKFARVTFTEITAEAVKAAMAKPRELDQHLIDAQQARRILDRLVGYKLSPFLWKKVYKGLSAGRVQSVATRLIVDRERLIQAFVPVNYWLIGVKLASQGVEFLARLTEVAGQKLEPQSLIDAELAESYRQALEKARYQIESIKVRTIERRALPPLTTSTLQQSASSQLGFSPKKTMVLAQQLYEAGRITYMRTDSLNISQAAIEQFRQYIAANFGPKYLPEKPNYFKTKSKGAQEAHEAIRPTDINRTPENLAGSADKDANRLYGLIWRRALACQMTPASYEQTTVKILAQAAKPTATDLSSGLTAGGQVELFDGFTKVTRLAKANDGDEDATDSALPKLTEQSVLDFASVSSEAKQTEPPNRFSEAGLIKVLEEAGIGRPSTYAPTLSTIIARGYVRLESRQLMPQEVGFIVTDLMTEHFPAIVDVGFTANLESELDAIADGEAVWQEIIDAFYQPFAKDLEQKLLTVPKQQTEEPTDELCDKCQKPMVIKMGRFGRFLACSGFPDCKNAKPIKISTGKPCPDCSQGDLLERTTRKRKKFWGCSRYPECKYATWDDPNQPPKPPKKTATDGTEPEPKATPRRTATKRASTKP